MTDFIGKSFGRYHILERLGEGGMAIVFKAFDTRLERDVAVKVIRTERLTIESMPKALKRFEREAKALGKLTHPNIVPVSDYGEYEGKPYLVMPYLPGGTLKQKMGKPIAWQEAIQLLLPIAEALDYAHSQNMIHRDVKPSNILLTDRGQPMLTDFGIAKVLDLDETLDLTGTSAAVGTPEYMAPEQATAKTADHRVDIYALGVVMYEMVTGRKPFIADTPMAVLIKHATEPLPRPKQFVSNLPDAVEKVLIKALAKNPEDRYQSMTELVASIERLLGSGKLTIEKSSKEKPKFISEKKKDKPVTVRSGTGVPPVYWVGGFAVVVLGFLLFSVLNQPSQTAEPTQLIESTQTETIGSTSTPIAVLTSTPDNTPTPTALPTEITDDKGVLMELVTSSDVVPFYLDKYEVTNKKYADCVTSAACLPPSNPVYYNQELFSNHPIVYVNRDMAQAYCEWRNSRLPTDEEWVQASTGFPWENLHQCDYGNYASGIETNVVNWRGGVKIHYCVGTTTPVGSYELGKSVFNIYDLVGNVSEWTSIGRGQTKGGSWLSYNFIETDYPLSAAEANTIGFRCAKDVTP